MRELGAVLRGRRLGWFGHVVKRDEAEILGETQLIEVPGRWPPGKPRKTWRMEKYAGGTCKSKLARGASSEQRSVADCHQPSHLVKLSSKEAKMKK